MYRYLILALVLAGCAASAGDFKRPADLYNPNPVAYPLHYGDPYIDIFYSCKTPAAGGLSVEGYAVTSTNAYTEVDNFEVKLTARAANNRRLATKWAYGDDQDASRIDPIPFDVSVPAAGEVARYDLYYDFQFPDGRTMQDQFATVKDVCGGRWRRKEGRPGS